jgi:hypothetical protein
MSSPERKRRKRPPKKPPVSSSLTRNELAERRASIGSRERVWLLAIDRLFRVFVAAIWAAGFFGIAYQLRQAVASLAGRNTTAFFHGFFNLSVTEALCLGLATLASGGYIHERRLRQKTTKQLGAYPTELEKRLDPDRSGSRLAADGLPRKETE